MVDAVICAEFATPTLELADAIAASNCDGTKPLYAAPPVGNPPARVVMSKLSMPLVLYGK